MKKLGKKNFEYITVKEICEKAGVNAHFQIPYLNYVKDNRRVFQATMSHPKLVSGSDIK